MDHYTVGPDGSMYGSALFDKQHASLSSFQVSRSGGTCVLLRTNDCKQIYRITQQVHVGQVLGEVSSRSILVYIAKASQLTKLEAAPEVKDQ